MSTIEEGASRSKLTSAEWEKIFSFQGYGNLRGPFWFIGMEEYGDESIQQLLVRTRFREIEDLARAHDPDMLNWPITASSRLVPTWDIMSQIVLNLSGQASWFDRKIRRAYQTQKLGRHGGETFLAELLPIPKRHVANWPHWMPFASREEYEKQLLPRRIKMLRETFRRSSPAYVFCYGKGYWHHYKGIFPEAAFTPSLKGTVEITRLGRTTIVLTPFFHYRTGIDPITTVIRDHSEPD